MPAPFVSQQDLDVALPKAGQVWFVDLKHKVSDVWQSVSLQEEDLKPLYLREKVHPIENDGQ